MGYTQRLLRKKMAENLERNMREELKRQKQKETSKCLGKTAKGKPCKNEALEGSKFCKVHQKEGE